MDRSTPPVDIERLLADRTSEAAVDASGVITPDELKPHHLLAVATTTEAGLDNLSDDFDWTAFLQELEALEEEEEAELLVRLVRHLGTRATTGIESASGIKAIGDRAYELRHKHPHVFICFLNEVHSLLRRDTSSEAVAAAEEQFRRIATDGERESNERIEQFRTRDLRSRLTDPTISTDARLSLLKTLGREDPENLPPDIVNDLLFPLRNHYDHEVERATLETLGAWTSQFPTYDNTSETVETLEAHLAGERDELSSILVMELLVVGYVAPTIVDWLTDLKDIEDRQEVVQTAFETLSQITGIRSQADQLCEFILEEPLSTEVLHAGIELLGNMLVGLQPNQHTEQPVQDDHIKQVFFTDEELSVDETIRDTLRAIADTDSEYPDGVRAHAVEVWLSVRPPEIHQVLWDIEPEAVGSDPVVDAKLRAAAEHRLIEFVDVVEYLWKRGSTNPDSLKPLVNTLEKLETHDIVHVLLDPAFDHPDPEFREFVRDVLSRSGYDSEIAREQQRRDIISRITNRYETMSEATETDYEIRKNKKEKLSLEGERKKARVESAETASKSIDTLVSFRASGGKEMLQLAPLLDELQELAAKIRKFETEAREVEREIEEELRNAKSLRDEIQRVENEIESKERELEKERRRKRELEDRIEELEYTEIPNVESDRDKLQRKMHDVGGEVDSLQRQYNTKKNSLGHDPPDWKVQQVRDLENELSKKQREYDNIESRYNDAQRELDRLRDELDNAKSELSTTKSNIRTLENEIRSLEREHDGLSNRLDESMNRTNRYEKKLQSLTDQLQEYRAAYEQVKQQIAEITGRITRIQNEATSRHDRLQRENEAARTEAKEARDEIRSVAKSQNQFKKQRRNLIRRIEELTELLDKDHDQFEDLGERTKSEIPEADTEAVDMALNVMKRQYGENVANWRSDSILRRSTESKMVEEEVASVVSGQFELSTEEGWK